MSNDEVDCAVGIQIRRLEVHAIKRVHDTNLLGDITQRSVAVVLPQLQTGLAGNDKIEVSVVFVIDPPRRAPGLPSETGRSCDVPKLLGAGAELVVVEYGSRFAAAVQVGESYAVQFHPEKSSTMGLRLLANFGRIVEKGAA